MKKISRVEAELQAIAYWEARDLKGWRYELSDLHHRHDRKWVALFDTYSPEGSLVDGPVILIIDANGVELGPDAL